MCLAVVLATILAVTSPFPFQQSPDVSPKIVLGGDKTYKVVLVEVADDTDNVYHQQADYGSTDKPSQDHEPVLDDKQRLQDANLMMSDEYNWILDEPGADTVDVVHGALAEEKQKDEELGELQLLFSLGNEDDGGGLFGEVVDNIRTDESSENAQDKEIQYEAASQQSFTKDKTDSAQTTQTKKQVTSKKSKSVEHMMQTNTFLTEPEEGLLGFNAQAKHTAQNDDIYTIFLPEDHESLFRIKLRKSPGLPELEPHGGSADAIMAGEGGYTVYRNQPAGMNL